MIPLPVSKYTVQVHLTRLTSGSRHGHVVIDGEGSNGNPVSDIWVSVTGPTHPSGAHISHRNSTTPASSGRRSVYHPVDRPRDGVPLVASTPAPCSPPIP